MLSNEGTDNTNAELLSLFLRQVTEGLEVKEYFLGFHRFNDTCSDHVIKARHFFNSFKSRWAVLISH